MILPATPDLPANLAAFLNTIAGSEGTPNIPGSDNGYRALFGGGVFASYADHPRIRFPLPRLSLVTTAAGRYQLLARYYDAYKHLLGLTDFSPLSQDKIAIRQITECKAMDDITAGRFSAAVAKCAHIWASLPGAGYNQPENKIMTLEQFYTQSGGILA